MDKNFLKEDVIAIIILIIFSSIVFSPFLFNEMPRTDAMAFYFRSWFIYDNLFKNDFWFNDLWYLGTYLYTFYPPLSFFITVILKFIFFFLPLWKVFNFSIFIYLLLFTVFFYILLRYLNFSVESSLITSLIAVTVPRVTVIASFTGAIPSLAAFAFYPIATLYLFKTIIEKEKIKNFILLAVFLSFIFLSHHTSSIIYFLFVLLPILFFYLKEVIKKIKYYILSAIIFLVLVSFWLVPFILENKYFVTGERGTFDFTLLFTFVDDKCMDWKCFNSYGIFFWILMFLGILLFFLEIKLEKDVLYISRRKLEKKDILILILFFYPFLFLLIQSFGIFSNLPLLSKIPWDRVSFLFIFNFSLIIAYILENKDKNLKHFLIIICSLILLYQSYVANKLNSSYLSEAAAIDNSPFNPLYDFIKTLEFGRIQSYGIYYPTFIPSIAIKIGFPVISGWYHEGDYKYSTLTGRIEDLSGQADFLDKITKQEFLNILNLTGTKYLIINLCSLEGYKVYMTINDSIVPIKRFGDCLFVFNTSFNSFSEPYLKYERIAPNIHHFYDLKEGEYLLKFTYYPYWKAYCDYKEINIFNSSNLIKIKVDENCEKLVLKFERPDIYKILEIISLIGYIIVFIVLFLPEKYIKSLYNFKA